jgi:hypothetical protein
LGQANLANCISLGGGLGLFHYFDYRPRHDVDAWWSDHVTESQRQAVMQAIQTTLSNYGEVRVRAWGDVNTVELHQRGKTSFSFQVARRSAHLEEPLSAGLRFQWIALPI